GNENTYISSADWMKRNFFNRVETCTPILDKKIKKRIIHEGLTLYWRDNVQSWIMQPDGTYKRRNGRGQKISAQLKLMEKLGTIG
ncbi:MAG: polyphosphate kinase, partial [Burkholderiales bacterium]|nr:polyphosphate kinase [Burkholderiales bacterium]